MRCCQTTRLLVLRVDRLRPPVVSAARGDPSGRRCRHGALLRGGVAEVRGVRKVVPRRGIISPTDERTDWHALGRLEERGRRVMKGRAYEYLVSRGGVTRNGNGRSCPGRLPR